MLRVVPAGGSPTPRETAPAAPCTVASGPCRSADRGDPIGSRSLRGSGIRASERRVLTRAAPTAGWRFASLERRAASMRPGDTPATQFLPGSERQIRESAAALRESPNGDRRTSRETALPAARAVASDRSRSADRECPIGPASLMASRIRASARRIITRAVRNGEWRPANRAQHCARIAPRSAPATSRFLGSERQTPASSHVLCGVPVSHRAEGRA